MSKGTHAYQEMVDYALDHPFEFDWSLQGFGMLRAYLTSDESVRLHVWNPDLAVENVSAIHDHPWDFDSWIAYGRMLNVRYVDDQKGEEFQTVAIVCGPGGGMLEHPVPCGLKTVSHEMYVAGDAYSQLATELHQSIPMPGCVSVITRHFGPDRDHARVCWRTGDWVSAEPRPATEDEVLDSIELVDAVRGRKKRER